MLSAVEFRTIVCARDVCAATGAHPLPHLRQDWGSPPPTSAPGLGSPLPHLRWDLLRYPGATLPTMGSLGEALTLVMCALGSLVPDGIVTLVLQARPGCNGRSGRGTDQTVPRGTLSTHMRVLPSAGVGQADRWCQGPGRQADE
jgi:hypothetical protein